MWISGFRRKRMFALASELSLQLFRLPFALGEPQSATFCAVPVTPV